MKNSIVIFIILTVFSVGANASNKCYNLLSKHEGEFQSMKMCIEAQKPNEFYKPVKVSLKLIGKNKVVFESSRFQLMDKKLCLDCNTRVYNVVYQDNDVKDLGFHNKYHNNPITINGNIDFSENQESGSISLGGESFNYFMSKEIGIERGLASQ